MGMGRMGKVAAVLTEIHNNSVLISNYKNTVQTDRLRAVAQGKRSNGEKPCRGGGRNTQREGEIRVKSREEDKKDNHGSFPCCSVEETQPIC